MTNKDGASHLNRNKIESNLSVPGIDKCHKNALYKSFEISPHFKCLCASTNIPLGPASGSGLYSGWPKRDVGAGVQTYQAGARFEAFLESVPMAPLDLRYTQVGFNFISVQVCILK